MHLLDPLCPDHRVDEEFHRSALFLLCPGLPVDRDIVFEEALSEIGHHWFGLAHSLVLAGIDALTRLGRYLQCHGFGLVDGERPVPADGEDGLGVARKCDGFVHRAVPFMPVNGKGGDGKAFDPAQGGFKIALRAPASRRRKWIRVENLDAIVFAR